MTIEKLFEKEIDRPIDPVISVENQNNEAFLIEVAEYVFTENSLGSMSRLLSSLEISKENTGVWINGYFGSGKSHFIKYLFHLFSKDNTLKHLAWDNMQDWTKKQTTALPDVTPALVADLQRKFSNRATDIIIFNIDAVADNRK